MTKKLLLFLRIYLLFVCIFIVEKPLFMLYYYDIYKVVSIPDFIAVTFHGLQLDVSMAAYLSVIPGLLLIVSVWANPQIIKRMLAIYFALISFIISTVFVVDLVLYRYWGFRLDSTPLFYLRTPKNAMASANWVNNIIGLLFIILISLLLYFILKPVLNNFKKNVGALKNKIIITLILLFATAALFLPIRGGVSASTMNVGKVYFSNKMELNHAAVNPMFSFFEALTMEQKFDTQFRYMKPDDAKNIFASMVDKPIYDSIPRLFTIKHPNIIIVVLESFMSKNMTTLGGLPNIAVRMNEFCKEGILFNNFYANSFCTDRSWVAIFSGYPAQPNTSIMKYARKTQSLPSIPKSLTKAGYKTEYYYGGDADFTNMRSYLVSMGIVNIISEKSFPLKERTTSWGVPDHIVFNKLDSNLHKAQKEPFIKIVQTLSSHLPFDVPFYRLSDPYLNSVAYTDSCLGVFIDRFKQKKWWKNSILILVPDHATRFPAGLENSSIDRYKIPLLIIGGAVRKPELIETYASQIDISATLLSQLNLSHSEFKYSKNILNPASPHFGYFTFPNGFGMITEKNQYIFDYELKKAMLNAGKNDDNKLKAEAFIQTLYDDLENR